MSLRKRTNKKKSGGSGRSGPAIPKGHKYLGKAGFYHFIESPTGTVMRGLGESESDYRVEAYSKDTWKPPKGLTKKKTKPKPRPKPKPKPKPQPPELRPRTQKVIRQFKKAKTLAHVHNIDTKIDKMRGLTKADADALHRARDTRIKEIKAESGASVKRLMAEQDEVVQFGLQIEDAFTPKEVDSILRRARKKGFRRTLILELEVTARQTKTKLFRQEIDDAMTHKKIDAIVAKAKKKGIDVENYGIMKGRDLYSKPGYKGPGSAEYIEKQKKAQEKKAKKEKPRKGVIHSPTADETEDFEKSVLRVKGRKQSIPERVVHDGKTYFLYQGSFGFGTPAENLAKSLLKDGAETVFLADVPLKKGEKSTFARVYYTPATKTDKETVAVHRMDKAGRMRKVFYGKKEDYEKIKAAEAKKREEKAKPKKEEKETPAQIESGRRIDAFEEYKKRINEASTLEETRDIIAEVKRDPLFKESEWAKKDLAGFIGRRQAQLLKEGAAERETTTHKERAKSKDVGVIKDFIKHFCSDDFYQATKDAKTIGQIDKAYAKTRGEYDPEVKLTSSKATILDSSKAIAIAPHWSTKLSFESLKMRPLEENERPVKLPFESYGIVPYKEGRGFFAANYFDELMKVTKGRDVTWYGKRNRPLGVEFTETGDRIFLAPRVERRSIDPGEKVSEASKHADLYMKIWENREVKPYTKAFYTDKYLYVKLPDGRAVRISQGSVSITDDWEKQKHKSIGAGTELDGLGDKQLWQFGLNAVESKPPSKKKTTSITAEIWKLMEKEYGSIEHVPRQIDELKGYVEYQIDPPSDKPIYNNSRTIAILSDPKEFENKDKSVDMKDLKPITYTEDVGWGRDKKKVKKMRLMEIGGETFDARRLRKLMELVGDDTNWYITKKGHLATEKDGFQFLLAGQVKRK
jgi:hypothetical protein